MLFILWFGDGFSLFLLLKNLVTPLLFNPLLFLFRHTEKFLCWFKFPPHSEAPHFVQLFASFLCYRPQELFLFWKLLLFGVWEVYCNPNPWEIQGERPFFQHLRVVILNHGPRLFFRENFDVSRKSESMNAPFFSRHETYGVISKKLFFPWRSPSSTYDPLNIAILAIFSLF